MGTQRRFTYQDKKYILFVTSDSLDKDAKPQIKLAEETPQSIKLLKVLESADFDISANVNEFTTLYNVADALMKQTAVSSD